MKKELTGYPSVDRLHEKDSTFFEKNPVIPSVSVYNVLKLLSLKKKDDISIDCLDLSATYNQLIKDVVVFSKALKELGVKEKDIITISMPNYYQGLVAYFAANRIGAVTTFVNCFSSDDEIKKYLNLYESPVYINFNTTVEKNKSIVAETKVRQTITLEKSDLLTPGFVNPTTNLYGYNNLLKYCYIEKISEYYKKPFKTMYSGKNDSLILYTSGTTGIPKSVVLTNENILAAEIYAKNTSHTETITTPKTLTCVPFSYPYGLITSALTSLLWGKETILAPNINKDTISYFYSKAPGIIFGSPAFLNLTMNNVPHNQNLSFVTHFISGGDFLTPSLAKRGNDFFESHGARGVEIGNGFGNAETVSIGSTPVGVPLKQNTAGKILVGSTAMILDPDTMQEKRYGEEGLLYISGKHVFKEYFKNTELTQETKKKINGEEYYNTGTLGIIDSEGYFVVTGRQSRFYIMSSLYKVYCDIVQNVLSTFDCIKECAVVPVSDDKLTYVNKAYVVLDEKYTNSSKTIELIKNNCQYPSTLQNGLQIQLKEYEIPTYIEIVSELPRKNGMEKVDYELLEHDAESKLALSLKK